MKRAGVLLLFVILLRQFVFAQMTITGTVTSEEDALGIPGAFVVVKGTQNGAATDIDGKYKITVPQGSTLVFSFVGLKSQEVIVTDQTTIDVILKSDVFKMDEVIVAGVASGTPKRKMSVSVSKIDAKELEEVPATSVSTALQGRVAGIVVASSSGNPGQSSGIRLRGSTSLLGSSDPLIIIDNVMLEGDMADINNDDVASYEVVKGASASALYGSRAGSGVIVITTKRGDFAEKDKIDIRVRNEYGTSSLFKEIKLAQHNQYRLADDYKQNGYTKYYDVTYPAGYTGGANVDILGTRIPDFDHYTDNPYSLVNDLQKEIFPSGNFYTNYFSIADNDTRTNLFASFENNHNSGIVFSKKGYNRQNFRLNADLKIFNNLRFSSSSLITQAKLDLPNGGTTVSDGGGVSSAFFDVLSMNPDINLNMDAPDTMQINKSVKYFVKPDQWALAANPKHSLFYETRSTKRNSVLQNLLLNYKTFSWLELEGFYSFEKRNIFYMQYDPVGYLGQNGQFKQGYEQKLIFGGLNQSFQATANINQKVGDLVTKAKLSYIFEKSDPETVSVDGTDFIFAGVTNLNYLQGKIVPSSDVSPVKAKDYFGILDLSFKDKYNATVLYRMDGSSLFGPNNRWNPYYRISGTYLIGEDLKIPGVQELRLRAAIGTSGQRPGFSYQYETFTLSNGAPVGYTKGNNDLKPSETKETEIALNGTFFNRFELEIIQSFNETQGDFIVAPLKAITGFHYQYINGATIKGSSFECTLGALVLKSKDLFWKVDMTFSKITQKVTRLDVPAFKYGPDNAFQIQAGQAKGIMYGFDWLRSLDQLPENIRSDYSVNSEGYVIPKGTEGTSKEIPIPYDKNGNGEPYKIADMNPDFIMAFSSRIEWKNISCYMLWNWKQGGNIYNATKQWLFRDQRAGVIDQYGKPDYQKKTTDYYNAFYDKNTVNSYFVENASYLKLSEFSIYYDFSRSFLSKNGLGFIKGIKVGILGRNLLTITKYTGWDPEVGDLTDPTNFVFDEFNYPNYRTVSASIDLNF